PPVSEQLGVVGRKNHRGPVHDLGQPADLIQAGAKEVSGMSGGRLERHVSVINVLDARTAGDAVVFDAGKAANLGAWQVAFEVVEVQIESDVAVEIAIARIAAITLLPAPDLSGRIEVATERGDAVGGEERGEDTVARPRPGEQNAVRIGDEPTNVGFLQSGFDPRGVGTFGQPDPARTTAKAALIVVARGEDLRADGGRMIGEQGKQRVGGGAGDDFQLPSFLK